MRKIDIKTDYPTLCEWWTSYDFPPVPLDCLPHTGLIVDGLCAGFIYKTDSSIAWVEWIVGNKKADKFLRGAALKDLMAGLIEEAKGQGFTKIFSSLIHPKLLPVYTDAGFIVTDSNASNVVLNMQGAK